MAVIMKNQFKFLDKIGVHPNLSSALTAAALSVELGFFDLRIKNSAGLMIVSQKLNKSTNDLMKGNVTATELLAIRQSVEAAIKMALESTGGPAPKPVPGTYSVETEASDKVIFTATLAQDGGVKVSATNPKIAAPVPLKDATSMYQPVKGTSPGSRYFVVAMNPRIKVAARIEGTTVSVRVEGNPLPSEVAGLSQVSLNKGGDYYSGHFQCGNVSPTRVVGAVLLGSGIDFDTPMPSLKKIV
jgi:hypothetical protein